VFKGKSIFISGGTGSLSHELVKQLLPFNPRKIVLYSRDDHKQRAMANKFNSPLLRFITGDIRDASRLEFALRDIDLVYHTAALKHVDLSEYNLFEYKEVIVDGAQRLIEACFKNNVDKCVALSTDKACAGVSVYGCSKSLSDRLFMAANQYDLTKFSVIRYGNVINSNGSFTKTNINDQPKTINITDKRMTRFWITLDRAAQLTTHLLKYSNGGELLIPKIPASNVLDLLKVANPDHDDIKCIGMRLGEKLHESMFSVEDCHNMLEFNNYYLMYPSLPDIHHRAFAGEVGCEFSPFEYNSGTTRWRLLDKGISRMLNDNYEWTTL
jgi:UDP-N-acetylglucosamine 4,6-dehydratase